MRICYRFQSTPPPELLAQPSPMDKQEPASPSKECLTLQKVSLYITPKTAYCTGSQPQIPLPHRNKSLWMRKFLKFMTLRQDRMASFIISTKKPKAVPNS